MAENGVGPGLRQALLEGVARHLDIVLRMKLDPDSGMEGAAVFALNESSVAISLIDLPAAKSRRTSNSRFESET